SCTGYSGRCAGRAETGCQFLSVAAHADQRYRLCPRPVPAAACHCIAGTVFVAYRGRLQPGRKPGADGTGGAVGPVCGSGPTHSHLCAGAVSPFEPNFQDEKKWRSPMSELQTIIETAFENRASMSPASVDAKVKGAVLEALDL